MTVTECRICLEFISGTNIISVQTKVTDGKNVLQAIEEVASLKGSSDDFFPQYMCKKCLKQLKSLLSFRRLIISSYKEFREKLRGVNKKVCKTNSSSDNFISFENQPVTATDLRIEEGPLQIHKKSLLEDKRSEELKAKSEEDSNDDGLNIKDEDRPGISVNAEPKTKRKRINKTRKKNENVSKNTSRIICSVCEKVVKGRQNYNAHMKMHNSQIPPLVYVCPVCPKQFSQKKYLIVHRRSHTGEKPFHCDICNKNFRILFICNVSKIRRDSTGISETVRDTKSVEWSQFASFYVHKRRLHDKVVQGTCNYCGKKFVDKPELDVHIKMWHTGERPYLCEFCSATFVCNRTLQRHRRELHSEKKPCDKCGKMLGDYALKKHLVRHEVLEEGLKIIRKKYTCEYCKIVMNFTSRRRHLEKQHGVKLYGRGDDCKKIPIKETIIKAT